MFLIVALTFLFLLYKSLRVAKMNNDLKEQDMAYSGDPMFDDILKDLLALTTSGNANTINETDLNQTDSNANDSH